MRVLEKPSLINNLQHGLTFATDSVVNSAIITKFRLYDYLTENDNANKFILNSIINEWGEYANKLYATTQYEYNPIWNVDGTEDTTTTTDYGLINTTEQKVNGSQTTNYGRVDTNNMTKDGTTQVYDNGYDSTTSSPTHNESYNTGTTTDTASGSDTISSSLGKVENANSGQDVETIHNERHGNIGVTSTQSLIEQERKIIIDVIDFYVNKFADAFAFSNSTFFEPLDA